MKKAKKQNKKLIEKLSENKIAFALLIFLLLFGALFGLIKLVSYTGYSVVNASGGYITEIILTKEDPTSRWNGFYGLALMMQGYDEQQYEDATPGGLTSNHLIFDCLEPNINHEVYASLVLPSTLDWSSVTPADPKWIDDTFNISSLVL